MINLYYSRSDTDSKKFMFEQTDAALTQGKKMAAIIVPDQYTLEAEKKAFAVLQRKGLMDLEIMSFSRLAARLVEEENYGKRYLDDIGRSMLIRKVISAGEEKLRVFRAACGKKEFVRMMGDLIQEFKQFKTSPQQLVEVTEENLEKFPDTMLMKKLKDAAVIYEAYEKELQGKYFDTEDYLSQLCLNISKTNMFDGGIVWITGFEFFSKRLLAVIEEISLKAEEVNISMIYAPPGSRDYNLFAPVENTIREIKDIGERIGHPCLICEIPSGYNKNMSDELAHLEKNLYAFPPEPFRGECQSIRLISCDNGYTEAEFIADEIRRLVTNGTYRFKDMAVVTNDTVLRGEKLKRAFERQGITFFDDSKVAAIYNRYMQIVLALCGIDKAYDSNDQIFTILKAGAPGISINETEILENYVLKYGIIGGMWRKEFYKIDNFRITEEDGRELLNFVNLVREKVVNILDTLEERLAPCTSGKEFSTAFFEFLQADMRLDSFIEEDVERLKENASLLYAGVTAQLWNRLVDISEQIGEVMGDSPCSREEFFDVLKSGIEAVEIGLIPTTIDQLLVGDYARTRANSVKVLFAAGFNDGVVPLTSSGAAILSDTEKDKLNQLAGEICTSGSRRSEKEKLDIYEILSLTSEKLYISYTCRGEEGAELRPSQLLLRINRIFPGLQREVMEEKLTDEDEAIAQKSRISYMLEHPEKSRELRFIYAGKGFRNREEFLQFERMRLLFGEEFVMSPSSLEAFSRCPFAHFMKYGIRADERKLFEISAPEMGTVFHEALMRFSQKMTEERLWSLADEDRCREVIDKFAEEIAGEFKKGQLFEGPVGEYRVNRIKSICSKTAYMVAQHVNSGSFDEFYFETAFGRNKDLPPLEIELPEGRRVFVEGRIDRIDLAHDEGETYIKVIDYKSGNDKVVKKEVLSGYKLQLLLYMLAAIGGMERKYSVIQPAGVFYFKIREPSAEGKDGEMLTESELGDFLEKSFRKSFKMDGIVVNELKIIDALDSDFSGYSDIIKVRKLKSGAVKGTGEFTALGREEFDGLLKNTMDKTKSLCNDFAEGRVTISPVKLDEDTKACTYCDYKSICCFDPQLPGFRFR